MEMDSFRDRVALITGSSRGIGQAIARKFAEAGADVVINYRQSGGRSQEQAEALGQEIREMGRRGLIIQTDISVKASVKAMFNEVKAQWGRVDFLILNAARAPFKPIEKLFERELRQLVETNYLGNIFCIQEALPFLEQQQGKIVFISSLGKSLLQPGIPPRQHEGSDGIRGQGSFGKPGREGDPCECRMRRICQDRFLQGAETVYGRP